MRFISIASAIVATASLALASGNTPSATINNNCGKDIYVWEVADATGPCSTVAPGGSLTKPYVTRSTGGVSIKMGWNDDIWVRQPLTQFEYTWTPGDSYGGLWYDISIIDGDPFADGHTQIIPNLASGVSNTSNCNTVNCPPGGHCIDAYNIPSDNQVVKTCPDTTNLVFNLCGTGSGSSSGSGSSASSAPAASLPAPSSVQATTPSATPAPAPTPTPTPSPAPSQAPTHPSPPAQESAPAEPATTVVTMTIQAVQTDVVAPGPNAVIPQWSTEDKVVHDGSVLKREAHANHMERHQRIARMHHARSA